MSERITGDDVLLYIPNLIGYGRVLAATSSFIIMVIYPHQYVLAVLLYLLSFIGDLVDGYVARLIDQTSSFGGVLDMITDRCGTAGFLFVLAGEYQDYYSQIHQDTTTASIYRLLFLFLMILDISSHWVQMHSSLALTGAHHKSIEGNKDKNFLVRWFYQYYWFFGYLCVGAEFTYILLYLRIKLNPSKQPGQWLYHQLVQFALFACVPGCIAKQIVNIAQLATSCYAIAAQDAKTKKYQ